MQQRTSYDTAVKHLYRKGLEEALPINLRKGIPRTTIHRWRHEKDNKYVGCEINELAKSELELLKEFARSRNSRRIFWAYVRLGRFIQSITKEKYVRQQFKKNKEELIDLVERTKETLSLDHVLKCFNLSRSTYNIWVLSLYSNCAKSKLDWCLMRQPHQLNALEIETMEDLLTDPKKKHWPISSIAFQARRNGWLYASLSTWYKYATLLKIDRGKPKYKKNKNGKGIKAMRPNQIWHADVTYFKIGLKTYYIYLVVDNFSKKILSHLASDKLSGANRLLTIRLAHEREHEINPKPTTLLVDGGAENNNQWVDGYIDQQPLLHKIRALHDIQFGNSQVEAHNRILKHNWLYHKKIETFDQLKKELNEFVKDFNTIRPHYSLEGMTPDEKHLGLPHFQDALQLELKEARKERVYYNKCNACNNCSFQDEVGKFK